MPSRFIFPLLFLMVTTFSPAKEPEIIAHRGYSSKAPENTLAAFKLAWEKGSDACENDIYLTSDGKIAVIHDGDTKRTTGEKKSVAQSTLAELQALDAGSFKGSEWKGEKIPNLAECLATMPAGKQRFFIEIKCGPEIVPALEDVLTPLKERAGQLCVISFNLGAAKATKAAMPWVQVYLLAGGKTKGVPRTDLAKLIEQAKEAKLDGLNLGADWEWNEIMVKQIRDAGLGVFAWTIDDPKVACSLAALGVDGITTNDPVLIREALAAKP